MAWKGKKIALAKMLPTCSTVDRSMVRWDNQNVEKFKIDKQKLFEAQVLDPLDSTEWCL